MPLISQSSYQPPFLLNNRHLQTILPSYMRKSEPIEYDRETYTTPEDDVFFLDWSRVGSDRLLIISHGLCGHSRRHYVLSLVKAFNDIGWDCLCWNYRGTGPSTGGRLSFTTNNSTNELGYIIRHAIETGHYRQVALTGYSMGGNLDMLYLCREAASVPKEVIGGAFFCATIDLTASSHLFSSAIGRLYASHFLEQLKALIRTKAVEFPGKLDLSLLDKVHSMDDFDEYYTAPMFGFKGADDYHSKASACNHLEKLRVPALVVNPDNDPFLAGDCYPVDIARHSKNLYLEMPDGGGHCGFITPGTNTEWWPARRAKEFITALSEGRTNDLIPPPPPPSQSLLNWHW
ncbi:MAG: alpha/beta fold hydrolase [Victivallales bacterium]|nr:alpha/beta fold hydrolase [Victivallales bacterium]